MSYLQGPSINGLLGGASIYGLLAVLLVARFGLIKRPAAAVTLTSIGIFCVAIVDMTLMPQALPVLLFQPVMAVAIALPYITGRRMMAITIAATATTGIIVAIARFVHLFEPVVTGLSHVLIIMAVTGMSGLTMLLLHQYQRRQGETLTAVRSANTALETARAGLEATVIARTAELRTTLSEVEVRATEQTRLLDELAQQRMVIRELSVPVLPVGPTTLVMPLIGTLDTARLKQVQDQALQAIERTVVRSLVLDITGVPIVDSEVAHGLLTVVRAARLLGVEVILVGVRPEVAQAVVGLGLTLTEFRTFPDLQTALARSGAAASGSSQRAPRS